VTILNGNAGAGDAIGDGRWIGGRSFEKSAHLLVESPGKRAFLNVIQTDSGAKVATIICGMIMFPCLMP
jgi:hypothetical protein